jgi:hypothetical protein
VRRRRRSGARNSRGAAPHLLDLLRQLARGREDERLAVEVLDGDALNKKRKKEEKGVGGRKGTEVGAGSRAGGSPAAAREL